ncbi:MAG: glycosyltransferase family 4 protein [Hyphomicrobiales bacterium]
MKKVLIITYYWPPSGGMGVQRWLKFVKYCKEFGWEPIVYAPLNPEYPSYDKSFEKDIPNDTTILRKEVWEPYTLYKRFVGRKKNDTIKIAFSSQKKKKGITEKISIWLRANLFIPDARCFWIKPSIKYLSKYIESNSIDAVVSTGPPHSTHMIARGLQKKFSIPWLADFRDPWTQVCYFKTLSPGKLAFAIHRKWELDILKNADVVTAASEGFERGFQELLNREYNVVHNGFDADDFSIVDGIQPDSKFTFVYAGSMSADRNPITLWKVLSDLCKEVEDFSSNLAIKVFGIPDITIEESVKENDLSDNVFFSGFVSYEEILKQEKKAQVLFANSSTNDEDNHVIPGKMYEYLAIGRPILYLGKEDSEASKLLSQTNAGIAINNDNYTKLKSQITDWYTAYKSTGKLETNTTSLEKYTRKYLSREFAKLLDNITDKKEEQ